MNQDETVVQQTLEKHEEPDAIVCEAVGKCIYEFRNVEDDIVYEERVAGIMASLKHPERDNSTFGAWRDSGIDGLAYQKALRGK